MLALVSLRTSGTDTPTETPAARQRGGGRESWGGADGRGRETR